MSRSSADTFRAPNRSTRRGNGAPQRAGAYVSLLTDAPSLTRSSFLLPKQLLVCFQSDQSQSHSSFRYGARVHHAPVSCIVHNGGSQYRWRRKLFGRGTEF